MDVIDVRAQAVDAGTGYGRPDAHYDRDLVEVGPRTPMGELLRRYWHPVALATDACSTPKRVRVLGEDLVLFRDGEGKPGLVLEHCTHRGTSLYYGRVEAEGIRCCYHGWLFAADGRCLDKAVEPGGGVRREIDRQPWYPVQERYGLIFAYLGPPERKPALPRYDVFENLEPGEFYATDDQSYTVCGPPVADFNWFQHYENFQDAGHVIWLHFLHSGSQLGEKHRLEGAKIDPHHFMDNRTFQYTESGMKYVAEDRIADGRVMRFVVQCVLPTVGIVPEETRADLGTSNRIFWVLPIDDTHFREFTVRRVRAADERPYCMLIEGKPHAERTPEDQQRAPGDYEAQVSQGAIALHSNEHLSLSDRGVIMLRKLFRAQLDALAQGHDPINATAEDGEALIRVEAGRFSVADGADAAQ
jgi:phenylpropionate dioxygenase-like ring-hydroxylating dioxygenase large terminal subunit